MPITVHNRLQKDIPFQKSSLDFVYYVLQKESAHVSFFDAVAGGWYCSLKYFSACEQEAIHRVAAAAASSLGRWLINGVNCASAHLLAAERTRGSRFPNC